MKPSREYMLGLSVWPRFLAASDAAWEGGRGSGGYLLVLGPRAPVEKRFGCAAQLDPDVYTVWGPQETYIAQLELHMVFVGMLQFASGIRGSRGIWFIDSIAALMALVRGRSNSESLDSMTRAVHAAAYALRAWIYFDWVESAANWSDGMRQEGLRDARYRRHRAHPPLAWPRPRCSCCAPAIVTISEYP